LVKVGVGVKEEVDGDDEDVSSPRAARGSLVAETRGGGSPVFLLGLMFTAWKEKTWTNQRVRYEK
jgi:hypothetical protein